MKYEITEAQMKTLVDIHDSLFDIAHSRQSDMADATMNVTIVLFGLIQHIEMQDVEDAT